MKKHLIGQIIRSARKARGLRQNELSAALGVCHQAISQWERGTRPFPARYAEQMAAVLQLAPHWLDIPPPEADMPRDSVRILFRPPSSLRLRYRPAYPISARVEHMTALGRRQQTLHEHVRSSLPPCEYEELAERFPRDSRWELQAALHVLADGARVVYSSPSRFRLPLNALHDCDWTDGQDLLQPVLLWEQGDERVVVFGQVWLNIPWHGPVRPDFLVWYKRKGQPGYWLYVEIDDDGHRDKQYQDQARALAISLPGLRYENYTTSDPRFFERLLSDIRTLRDKARKIRRDKRRRARELEEERWLRARKKQSAA